jgi:hypothetical protein
MHADMPVVAIPEAGWLPLLPETAKKANLEYFPMSEAKPTATAGR